MNRFIWQNCSLVHLTKQDQLTIVDILILYKDIHNKIVQLRPKNIVLKSNQLLWSADSKLNGGNQASCKRQISRKIVCGSYFVHLTMMLCPQTVHTTKYCLMDFFNVRHTSNRVCNHMIFEKRPWFIWPYRIVWTQDCDLKLEYRILMFANKIILDFALTAVRAGSSSTEINFVLRLK